MGAKYEVPADLVDYAKSHDSDEAEALLDVVENGEKDAQTLYNAAKAFFDRLVEDEVLDEEDRADYVGAASADEEGDDSESIAETDETVKAIINAEDVDDLANAIADSPDE